MANSVKAGLSERIKRISYIKIAVVATVSVVGIGLAIFSIFKMSFLFAAAYLIAGLMGVFYTIIEINSTLVPSVECDGEKLFLSTWDNNIFPYRIDFNPRFFADFVPAKSVCYNISLDDIADMAIGTKGFLCRTLKSQELLKRFDKFADLSKRVAAYLKRCDILCVRLKDDSIYMMSVNDFNMDSLYKIVDMTEHCIQGLEFKTSIRQLRKKRETIDVIQ